MDSRPPNAAERLRGIGLFSIAVLCFALLDTCVKYATRSIPFLEIAWFRYAVHLTLTVAILRPWRDPSRYRLSRPLPVIGRSLCLVASSICAYFALTRLPLSTFASILFATPLIVAAAAGPLLGEWIGPRRWAAVAVGFLGVIVITAPGSQDFDPMLLFALAAAFLYAAYLLASRLLSHDNSALGMLINTGQVPTLLLAPALPFVWVTPPDWAVAAALVATGAFGAVGHYFLNVAHTHAPASVLAPFTYLQLVWVTLFGHLLFGDVPSLRTLAGAAIVAASGLYLLSRERASKAAG